MYRYFLENNAFREGIHQNTIFEGKPIGVWQDNMRQAYYKGKLKIDPELEEMFLRYGILRKQKIIKKKAKTAKEENDTKKQGRRVALKGNNDAEVQELVDQILLKQKIIEQQQKEISELRDKLSELNGAEIEI